MFHSNGVHYEAVATKAVAHGAPCIENGIAGVAFRTKADAWSAAYSATPTVQIGETFAIRCKGVVRVPKGGLTVSKGTTIYIVDADNTLQTASGAGRSKMGRVVAVESTRGLPAGVMLVDLDTKDSF